jgi:hypothetical protein
MKAKQVLRAIVLLVLVLPINLLPRSAKAQEPEPRIYNVTTTEDLYDGIPNDICAGWVGPNPGDYGPCSLRAALTEAIFTYREPRFIDIKLPPGTYKLTITESPFDPPAPDGSDHIHYGDLDLIKTPNGDAPNTVRIEGTGGPENPSIIDANFIDRVLEVGEGRTLYLKNLIIKNGLVEGENANEARGGGIRLGYNSTLYLTNVRMTNNTVNCAPTSCYSQGGAISSENANLSLMNVELDHNNAEGSSAIYFWDGNPGPGYSFWFQVDNSTIHHNSTDYQTIHLQGRLFLNNTTMTDNLHPRPTSSDDPTEILVHKEAWIQNSTILISGSGDLVAGNGTTTFRNSILINTTGHQSGSKICSPNIYSNHITRGGNIFSDDSCSPDAALGDLVRTYSETRLGPLMNNGGPTPTIALLAGSPAINRLAGECRINYLSGDEIVEGRLTSDQRGEPRDDGRCDTGAFEGVVSLFTLQLPILLK